MPIHGQVSFLGQPVTSGTLTFFPTRGRPIAAVISSDGSYACQVPAGNYRVTIAIGVKLPAGWQEGDSVPKQDVRLPARYASRVKTPLTASIAEDQSDPVDFSLE